MSTFDKLIDLRFTELSKLQNVRKKDSGDQVTR